MLRTWHLDAAVVLNYQIPPRPPPGLGHGHLITGILSPHASRRPFYLAGGVALAIIAVTATVIPIGARHCLVLPTFISTYASLMSMITLFTAYFLAIQFRSSGNIFLAALAGAFGYVAVLVFTQMLVFPGVFAVGGLFHCSPQSSIWIWAAWHTGFPLFVLAALSVAGRPVDPNAVDPARLAGRIIIFAGPLLAAGLGYFCIAHGNLLPPLINGTSYIALRQSPIMPVMIGTSLVAILVCARQTRLNNLLSLWLAIALLASVADAALTLSGSVRYDLGWYAGRILSIVSASVVFCMLVFELSQMYDRMVALNGVLGQRAIRDGLTAAFNRGFFAEQFPREVKRALREQNTMSLLLIDVDHFKTYNDLLGHQQGDECLTAIVSALQNGLRRPADFVARYGGEEFAVVLPSTAADGAYSLAEEMREAVAGLDLPRGDTAGGRVTISLGLATLNGRTDSFDATELLRRADRALYQAKHEGRDAIRVYTPARAVPNDRDQTLANMLRI